MSEKILERVRKLNWVLSESATGDFSFDELCQIIAGMLDSNIYVLNGRGKVLASTYIDGEENPLTIDDENKAILPGKLHEKILKLTETRENLTGDQIKEFYGNEYTFTKKYHTIVPVIFGGRRIATLIAVHASKPYSDEDIAICEYAATVVGIEVSRGIALEEEDVERAKSAVTIALETLSYSELDAIKKIFAELPGNDGLLVASKIADKAGITRSVIVNALRKFESAGVIESRSLGMKGTRIKITNPYLRDGIEKIDI